MFYYVLAQGVLPYGSFGKLVKARESGVCLWKRATTTRKTTREVEDDEDERGGLLSPPSFSPHKGSRQDTQGLGIAAAAGEPKEPNNHSCIWLEV